jgi:hypothetical protein
MLEFGSTCESEGEDNDYSNSNKRDLSLNSSVEQELSKAERRENDRNNEK